VDCLTGGERLTSDCKTSQKAQLISKVSYRIED